MPVAQWSIANGLSEGERLMWTRLKIAREGHMSPFERAAVLGIATLCVSLLAYLFDEEKGPGRFVIGEVPLNVAAMAGLGLLSTFAVWLRAPLNALLGTAVFIASGVLASRPHTLDAGVVVGSLLSTTLEGAAIGVVDLPAFWRRWASSAKSGAVSITKWSAYYVVTAVVWLCFIVALDILCDALVSTVLPSPKNIKSVSAIAVGIGLLGAAAVVLLLGRNLSSMPQSVRIVQPSLWALLVVTVISVLTEFIGLVIAQIPFSLSPWAEQAQIRESAQNWTSAPSASLREWLAVIATFWVVTAPLAVALGVLWDRARSHGQRSYLVSGLVILLLVVCFSSAGGGLGLFLGKSSGSQETVSVFNRTGAGLGLVVGLLAAWQWLRWSATPRTSQGLASATYVSGEADIPEHVANAVRAARETMP